MTGPTTSGPTGGIPFCGYGRSPRPSSHAVIQGGKDERFHPLPDLTSVARDKSKPRPQDAQRVNVQEDSEVEYWSKKLKCTPAMHSRRTESRSEEGWSDGKDVENQLKGK